MKNKDGYNYYFEDIKFDNGLYGRVVFYNPDNCSKDLYVMIVSVGNKRKNVMAYLNETSGSNAGTTNKGVWIESLVWAKNKIIEFEEMMRDIGKDIRILIYAEDSRRYKVYKRGLLKMGFIEGNYYGCKGFMKKCKITGDTYG